MTKNDQCLQYIGEKMSYCRGVEVDKKLLLTVVYRSVYLVKCHYVIHG